MRELIKEFVKICAEDLPIPEPIYEFGSFRVPEQEELANLRPLFPHKKYVGADMRKGTGVDVILDLHKINLPKESVGTILMIDTIEHVEFPRKAIKEAHRILKPDGIVIISSVMNFRIHDYPHDYWRFTPEAFKSLLKPFRLSLVESVGKSNFPHTVVGIGSKSTIPTNVMSKFKGKVKNWKEYWDTKSREGWTKLAAPPILSLVYKKVKKMLQIGGKHSFRR